MMLIKRLIIKVLSWLPKKKKEPLDTLMVANTIPDKKDKRDISFVASASPEKRFHVIPNLPPIRNQGPISSCASFAATRCHEIMLKQENRYIEGSELFHYYNAIMNVYGSQIDSGMPIRDACKTSHKYGMAMERAWPYDSRNWSKIPPKVAYWLANLFPISRYERVLGLDSIKVTLDRNIPVICGIMADREFFNLSILNWTWKPKKRGTYGHAVNIIGYDDEKQEFIIENSWGTNWGKAGRFRISYSDFENVSFDTWRMLTEKW